MLLVVVIAFLIGVPLVIKADLRQAEKYAEWIRRQNDQRR